MGKYCTLCKKLDVDLPTPIQEIIVKVYVNGKWYTGHKADVCENCREKVLISLDILPSDLV